MKKKIIICVIIISIIIGIVILTKKEETKYKVVSHKVVNKLYKNNEKLKCTDFIKIDKEYDINGINKKVILYLIFSKLDLDNLTYENYYKHAKKILDNVPNKFEYTYKGYKYTLNNKKITKEKASCDKYYVTKLYGYTNNNQALELNVMAGYIKGNKVYDLDNNELGKYDEDTLNKVLDTATMQTYKYKKVDNNYKLTSVKNG